MYYTYIFCEATAQGRKWRSFSNLLFVVSRVAKQQRQTLNDGLSELSRLAEAGELDDVELAGAVSASHRTGPCFRTSQRL
ncbi:hypothetical protein ASD64_13785 [Mesorhizobium sp. Root157]|nr:hypothetical protein ASD64_13785 [Mesorhizobium sp. Root157]